MAWKKSKKESRKYGRKSLPNYRVIQPKATICFGLKTTDNSNFSKRFFAFCISDLPVFDVFRRLKKIFYKAKKILRRPESNLQPLGPKAAALPTALLCRSQKSF